MAKDPAFLFYTSDFLTGTMFMSNEQIGIYIKLLCCQHQHGGLIDKSTFDSMVGNHQIIRSKFIETEHGFYNERLTIEVEKRQKKSSNMSEVAKNVWKERKYKKEEKVKELNTKVKNSSTKKIQIETENEDENINENVFVVYNVEKELLKNQIEFESICMRTGKDFEQAKDSLRKYHLYLEEKEQYPKGKRAVFSGFEKWLMNEKKYNNGHTTTQTSNKHKGAMLLVASLKKDFAARGKENT